MRYFSVGPSTALVRDSETYELFKVFRKSSDPIKVLLAESLQRPDLCLEVSDTLKPNRNLPDWSEKVNECLVIKSPVEIPDEIRSQEALYDWDVKKRKYKGLIVSYQLSLLLFTLFSS